MRKVVLPAQPMCTDSEEVGGHFHRVECQPHLRSRLMGPIDRNFSDLVATTLCHQQNLDIKTEPVHAHTGEQILGHLRTKQLEAALSVFHSRVGEPFNQSMKCSAHQMPVHLGV